MILKFLNGENCWSFVESEFITFKGISFSEERFKDSVDSLRECEAADWESIEEKNKCKDKIYANMLKTFVETIPCYGDRIYYNLNNTQARVPEGSLDLTPFVGVTDVVVALLNNKRPDYSDDNTQAIVFSTNYSIAYILNNSGKTIERIV